MLIFYNCRRIKISLFITFIEMVGELISALICIFLTVEVILLKFIFALFWCVNHLQASAWLLLVLSLPCLVSTSCFAPDSPRFLLYRNDKTACVDSLQWLRGSLSDLAGEFTQISNKLENALGSRWKCFVTWSTLAYL